MPTNTNLHEELEEIHSTHIIKLKSLHASEIVSLQSLLKSAQERCREQEEEVEGLKEQVSVLRQSFEMVQERLKRVLLEQDQLVDLIQGLSLVEKTSALTPENNVNKGDQKRIRSELLELEKIYGIVEAQIKIDQIDQIDDENNLKVKDSCATTNSSVPKYLLHCVKYLRKLQSADPVQLCRLLDLPFTAEKPFALSDSLLSGMATYARAPDSDFACDEEARIVRLLVCELIESKRESFALVKRMIEDGCVGIDEFTEKGKDESSCIRVALKGNQKSANNKAPSIMNLLSKLL